jgi:hypothetical protein
MKDARKGTSLRKRVPALALALSSGAAQAGPADMSPDPLASPPPQAMPALARDARPYKSYGAAALEILGFQFLLNRFDHAFVKPDDYGVSIGSIRRNLHSSWVLDRDPFEVNQLGHPYQGSVYFGLARSNGLSFWESLGYAFGGSAVWEIAGETTPPSRNDQITTSFGGSFLGEALYRMANLVIEQGYGLAPPWHEAAAAVISPPLGFVRQHRGGHGAGLWASNGAPVFARLQLGASTTSHVAAGPSRMLRDNEAAADFALEYGLPGKPGYTYRRPFDYFRFHLRLSNVQGVETLTSRGLLIGAPFESGKELRGIAGLYGSYDYLSPQLFRVASTGLSLGSNAQWWLADGLALQGHASGGIGYTSTGTVRASASRQYNYGFAPQATAGLRLICGDQLAFELNAREFFNGKLTSPETGGTDRVFRGDASVTYKLQAPHAVTLKYISSRRSFVFPGVLDTHQRRDSVGLYYTWQPERGMGAVAW